MAKEIKLKGARGDLQALINRHESYQASIDIGVASGAYRLEERDAVVQAGLLSVVEGLGSKELSTHLTDKDIHELTETLNTTSQQIFKNADETNAKKFKMNMSKTEAALKGFSFPTNPGGPAGELELHGLDYNKDLTKIMNLTKQSLVELNGRQIPRDQYSDKIINSVLDKASKDPDLAPKIDNIQNILLQGVVDKEKRKKKFNASDLPELEREARSAANAIQASAIKAAKAHPQKTTGPQPKPRQAALSDKQKVAQDLFANGMPSEKPTSTGTVALSNKEKKQYATKLAEHVILSDTGAAIARSKNSRDIVNLKVLSNKALSTLRIDGDQNPFGTIDNSKFTKSNFDKIQAQMNNSIEAIIPARELSEKLAEKGLRSSEDQKKVLLENIIEISTELGSDYLKNHKNEITDELTQQLKEKKSIGSRLFGRFRKNKDTVINPERMNKAVTSVIERHKPAADKAKAKTRLVEKKVARKNNAQLAAEREARAVATKRRPKILITKQAVSPTNQATPPAKVPMKYQQQAQKDLKAAMAKYNAKLDEIKQGAPKPKQKPITRTELASRLEANKAQHKVIRGAKDTAPAKKRPIRRRKPGFVSANDGSKEMRKHVRRIRKKASAPTLSTPAGMKPSHSPRQPGIKGGPSGGMRI